MQILSYISRYAIANDTMSGFGISPSVRESSIRRQLLEGNGQ